MGRIRRESLSVVSGSGDSVSRVKVQGDSVNVKSEDNQRFLHPLESRSVLDFVDKDIGDVEPVKPTSLEETPFKLVEEVKDLKYQNADWRLRPLPDEMLRYSTWIMNVSAFANVEKYAREDTHYSLYIYDMMKIKLLSMSKESESSDASLIEVYKCSYDKCLQVYEKEFLTEDSYLYIYGLVPYYLSLR
ncbi:hypothetical protein Patl1_22791 [Pistacia atlantica]|uniref:Uncharacterized protein n=1 Tax=Pistacia atlantica TaxID=434234 RepID=A0ACC1A026_9ROSI|nr:hypothetical protein Patl1_22791 [Pistacia atlantica]